MTSSPHLTNLISRAPALSSCLPEIVQAFEAMRDTYSRKGKLLLCGNGGSCADADHWVGELLKGFCSKRPLSAEQRAKLPEALAGKLQGALPAIPLSSFPALSSAFANDVDPAVTYAQLVWGLGQQQDTFIGMSTSGNAENVCNAAQVAKAMGLKTVAFTGQTGGKLKGLCDIAVCVPATETYLIQEFHLPIYHCICLMLEDTFFPLD